MSDLRKKIEDKINEIKKTADEYPGAVVIHNMQELRIAYMSGRGLTGLEKTLEEVQDLPIEEYHKRYFNPEDAKDYMPRIKAMLLGKNPHEVISFFQQVRTAENGEWVWHLTSMRILMNDDDGNALLTISFAIPIDPKNHVTNKVNRLLEENTFLRKNYALYSSLGKREKEVLRLLAIGKSNGEIAKEMYISEMTVRTHRKNINKKLNIKSNFDLQQFARAFDLI